MSENQLSRSVVLACGATTVAVALWQRGEPWTRGEMFLGGIMVGFLSVVVLLQVVQRRRLFAMITMRVRKLPAADGRERGAFWLPSTAAVGSAHYKKHTTYVMDYKFAEHLKMCPHCRTQLIASLQETIERIDSGILW